MALSSSREHQSLGLLAPGTESESETDKSIEYILYTFVLPSVVIVGSLLNLVVVCVFNNRLLNSSYTFYIRSLAVIDILSLLLIGAMNSQSLLKLFVDNPEEFFNDDVMVKLFVRLYPVIEIAQVLVTVYSVLVIMDHFVFEYRARTHLHWTEVRNAQKVTFIVLGVTVVFHIPNLFKLLPSVHRGDNYNITEICISTMYLMRPVQVYDNYVYPVIFILLPGLSILCFSIGLAVKLCKSDKADQIPYSNETGEFYRGCRSAKTTLSIAFLRVLAASLYIGGTIFNLLQTPYKFYDILPCLPPKTDVRFQYLSQPWGHIMVTAAVLDSSYRFFMYLATQPAFREVLRQNLLCCQRKKAKGPRYVGPFPPLAKSNWTTVRAVAKLKAKARANHSMSRTGQQSSGSQAKPKMKIEVIKLEEQVKKEVKPANDTQSVYV